MNRECAEATCSAAVPPTSSIVAEVGDRAEKPGFDCDTGAIATFPSAASVSSLTCEDGKASPFRWQNQRYFAAIGWSASVPSALGLGPYCKADPAPWTTSFDEVSEAVAMDGSWCIVMGAHTDEQGWIYAGSFDSIDSERAGGRGLKRVTDVVRRRCWVRNDDHVVLRRLEHRVTMAELEADCSNRREDFHDSLNETLSLVKRLLSNLSVCEAAAMGSPVAWYTTRKTHQQGYKALLQSEPTGEMSWCLDKEDMSRMSGLLYALPYAKAVYGSPMHGGHIDSAISVSKALLHRLRTPGYDPITSPDAATHIEAMLAICNCSEDDILHVCFHVAALRPAHAVLLDHAAGAVVLAIRGSMSPEDAFTDSMANEVIADELGDEENGIHNGMLRAAKWIAQEVRPFLEIASQKYPSYRLVITGHSLGAGVAAVMALLLEARSKGTSLDHAEEPNTDDDIVQASSSFFAGMESYPKFSRIDGYGFATPAVVSVNMSISEHAKCCFTTLVNARDVIPRLCLRSVEQLVKELSGNSLISWASSMVSKVWRKQEKVADAASPWQWPQHLTVGSCFLIPGSKSSKSCIYRTSPYSFDKILVHENMMFDHIFSAYERGLVQACSELGLTAGLSS